MLWSDCIIVYCIVSIVLCYVILYCVLCYEKK
jgi:hypothetical protein